MVRWFLGTGGSRGCWVWRLWLRSRCWKKHLLDRSHLLGKLGLAELLSAAELGLLACLSL